MIEPRYDNTVAVAAPSRKRAEIAGVVADLEAKPAKLAWRTASFATS